MESRNVIVRHGIPTSLDQAPYGTVCNVVDHHQDKYDTYLQVGKNEEIPEWELLESFNARTSSEHIEGRISSRLRKNIHHD